MPKCPIPSILTWLLLASMPALSENPRSDGGSSPAPSSDSTSAESVGTLPPIRGKLLSSASFDGRAFFAFGHGSPGDGWAWNQDPGMAQTRGALVTGWQPSFLGLDVRLALAGVFWETLPPVVRDGFHDRIQYFRFELDEAWLKLPFEVSGWRAAVQAGIFRWRSHREAASMGEYLARWDAYPGVAIRGDQPWAPLDSLSTRLTGLRLALVSPGGVYGHELIALRDGRGKGHTTLLGSGNYMPAPGLLAGIGAALDELVGGGTTYPVPVILDDTSAAGSPSGAPRDSLLRFDTWATRFSARMMVDIATLWTGQPRGDRGGRLFAEAALLGWRNYPPFYANRSRRLHLQGGLYLPAFGILHAVRLQAERRPVPDWMGIGTFYREGEMDPVYVRVSQPASRWRTQLYLCRSLLPWLDLEASAWRGFGSLAKSLPETALYYVRTPGVEPVTHLEARITARL